MDSASSTVVADQRHQRPPQTPVTPDRVEVTPPPPPPPRHPLRRRQTDTDGRSPPSRPCPAPPVPAREPRDRPPCRNDQRQGGTALDSVVPLSRWPLPPPGPSSTTTAAVMVDKPPGTTQEDGVRRAPATLPVNMMTMMMTSNHQLLSPTVRASSPPKTCLNPHGNVYVDSPTTQRGGAVAVIKQSAATTTTTDGPQPTDGRRGPLRTTPHGRASSPTVKFNPVVQTNGCLLYTSDAADE